ncbi:Acyl dehydratase [Variovorax sp. EL159]|nr:Acyl dehydratase [Variovorax sp. EL159]
MMKTLNFDALEPGDTLPPLALAPITRTTLALFAGASNDHNPMHIDLDFAQRGGMPDVFAHGMLSMAYLGRLLTQWVDQRKVRQFNARFAGITHLGNAITCTGEVIDMFEADGEERVKVEIRTTNQDGEVKILGDAVIAR